MTVKTPTRTYPFIPYRKTIEIDYDSLDFDPYESVEKPDAMLQHNEQSEMFTQIRAHFAASGSAPTCSWTTTPTYATTRPTSGGTYPRTST